MGASHNEATLQQTCLAQCQQAAAEPVAEPAAEPGTEDPMETAEPGTEPPIEPAVLEQAQFTAKLMAAIGQRADEAEAAGHVEKARNLRMVANKEAYIQLQTAGVPSDSQQVLAAEMAARQAAEEVVEEDFNAETDTIFSGLKIDEVTLQHYHDSIETLGIECGDEAEAAEVADSESETLQKAVTAGSHLSQFQANQGEDTAGYMENKCGEDTLNLSFFVDKLVAADHLHAGSAFLMKAYSSRLHQLSHNLEFHAKAALALHDETNGLAHHFVAHLRHQDNARRAAAEKVALDSHTLHLKTSVHKMLHEAARSDLTDKQRARLSKLDEKHHEAIHGESKDSMCVNHAQRLQQIPDDSPLNSPVVKDYVACLCERNEPYLVCQAKHGAAVNQVARQMAALLANASQSLRMDMRKAAQHMMAQSLQLPEPIENLSQVALAEQQRIAFGICKKAFACKMCVAGVCSDKKKMDVSLIRAMFGRGFMNQPACLSGDCHFCTALNPDEFVQFRATLGFKVGGHGNCDDAAGFLASFHFHLSLIACLGGQLGNAAEWLGVKCMSLVSTQYYPFIGKMVPLALSLNVVVARAKLSTHVPVHELSCAVHAHCEGQKYENEEACARLLPAINNKGYPKWKRDAWKSIAFFKGCYWKREETAPEKCLREFQEARGKGGLTLKVDIGVMWWWENVYKDTFHW